MRTFDVWRSDILSDSERVEADSAQDAASKYAREEYLLAGSQVTVRELSGSRERRVFRVRVVVEAKEGT